MCTLDFVKLFLELFLIITQVLVNGCVEDCPVYSSPFIIIWISLVPLADQEVPFKLEFSKSAWDQK